MGAYLSEPVTEKISSDEANDILECGASSMQGWRVNQEDAHNTILDFDENTAFFAVYDGHGGAEVATYCSQSLPKFIKETEAYKNGNLAQALEDAFLGFDATIPTKEVMDMLKTLAGEINPPAVNENYESEEDENVSHLFQEAKLPLKEVLAKYESQMNNFNKKGSLADNATPLSPFLRAKKNPDIISEPSASGSGASTSAAGSSSENVAASSSKDLVEEPNPIKNGDEDAGVSSTNEEDKDVNGVVSTSESTTNVVGVVKPNTEAPDSSEDNCVTPEQSEKPVTEKNGPELVCNGEVTDSKADGEDNNITSSNGANHSKDHTPESSSEAQQAEAMSPKKCNIRRAAAAVYKSLLLRASEDDDDDDEDETDSNDETFEGGEINSSDEENVNGVSDSECEEEEEEENESSDEDGEEDISMAEEPGNDSGCTAVVALLKGNELFVANAGDSRCIVCRDSKAVDMSIDHKPEDALELERVTKAGGKVSSDGRINGGLNLSRAIGDHSYKQNKELGPKEQMITALPDVKTMTIDPVKDQFMLLACDGIWNFMSSQDVCDFIVPKLAEGREKLSQICEEMFDHCLAPSTIGDGTGCDNMTAILVRFKNGLITDVVKHTETKKRAAEDNPEDEVQESKRPKIDDSLSSSVVTSSV